MGPWAELRERFPDVEVMGSEQHVVIPGLINAHHHSNGATSIQQGISDRLLEPWLLTLAARRRADPYLSTLLSAARLLRSGVTSVVDMHSGHGTPEAFEQTVRRALRGYDEAGMRVAFAIGMTEQSHLVWGEDEAFLASLPADARALAETRLPQPGAIQADDFFAIFADLWRDFGAHSRIDLWFGPPGPQWCSDEMWGRIAERAAEYGTGIQTHLLESVYEKLHGQRSYGQPSLLHLRDLGVLSPRFSCAHGVWLSDQEIEVMAETGVSLSHNPSSNLRLRAGIAPLNRLLEAGVNVALGMDGTTLNDDEDYFTEMRLALRLNRAPGLDLPAPTVTDLWTMATGGGARLLGAGKRLGRLEAGWEADLVLLRAERLSWPWVAPESDPLLLLLARAQAQDVESVLVGGELVLDQGVPTRIDVEATGQALAEELAATPFPTDKAEMVAALRPLVEEYYRQWSVGASVPYTAYNSRL